MKIKLLKKSFSVLFATTIAFSSVNLSFAADIVDSINIESKDLDKDAKLSAKKTDKTYFNSIAWSGFEVKDSFSINLDGNFKKNEVGDILGKVSIDKSKLELEKDDVLAKVIDSKPVRVSYVIENEMLVFNTDSGGDYIVMRSVESKPESFRPEFRSLRNYTARSGVDDEFQIQRFDATVRNLSQKNGVYVYETDGQNNKHRKFVIRLNYALSGTGTFEPEAVKFTVPLRTLRDRNGQFADSLEMSVPEYNHPDIDDSVKWVYKKDGDKAVIYNRQEIPAGENGFLELAYVTTNYDFNYVDMKPFDDFKATMEASKGTNKQTKTSEVLKYALNTQAEILSVEKMSPTLYKTWNSEWGAKPSDSDQYYYLVWGIHSTNTANQPYRLEFTDKFNNIGGSVVGYVFSGERSISDKIYVDNVNTSYKNHYRYDSVVTKHKISEYESLNKYSLKNWIEVKLIPIDKIDPATTATSERTYFYEKPVFYRPTGHFYSEKFGLDFRDYYIKDSNSLRGAHLSEFKDGEIDRLDNIRYETEVRGFPFPWTLPSGSDPLNPRNYGKEKVKYWMTDEKVSLDDTNRTLTSEDFEFNELYIYANIKDALFNEDKQAFESVEHKFNNSDTIDISVKLGSNYVKLFTYNYATKAVTNKASNFDSIVQSIDTNMGSDKKMTVKFKQDSNVVGWRIDASNSYYNSEYTIYPKLSLKKSQYIMDYVRDKSKISIKNENDGGVNDKSGAKIFSRKDNGKDYVIGTIKHGNLAKKVSDIQADPIKKTYNLDWEITLDETYLDTAMNKQFVPQQSGKFYDLLPLGSDLKMDTLKVYNDKGELPKGSYGVRYENNYKNTSRDMLIISVNSSTATTYRVKYKTLHSWDSITDFGDVIDNDVAYETGNKKLGDGLPDNGEGSRVKDVFNDLNPSHNDPKFVYAEHSHRIDTIMYATLGLRKLVKSEKDERYMTKTETTINGKYSYFIRFATDDKTQARDLVVYDSLENFKPDGKVSDWRGKLVRINSYVLKALGVNPVNYYSRIPDLDISRYKDLDAKIDGQRVWIKESEFGNLNEAKAFAVDLRYGIDGQRFTLPKNTGVEFTVDMLAPDSVASVGHIPKAYNNIYLYNTSISELGGTTSNLVHQNFTTVDLKIKADVNFKKVAYDNHDIGIEGARFKIIGKSAYGNDYDDEYRSDSNGFFTIRNLEQGTYRVMETSVGRDWLLDPTEHTVEVNGRGEVIYDGQKIDEAIVVPNKPRVWANINFTKKGYVGKKGDLFDVLGVMDAEFNLKGTSVYGTDYNVNATSNTIGRVLFNNIEQGEYELREIKAPNNFALNKTVFKIKIDGDKNISMIAKEKTKDPYDSDKIDMDYNGPIIYNYKKYNNFYLKKIDSKNTHVGLEGAEFNLKGVSDFGSNIDITRVSERGGTEVDSGMVRFENIEFGTYILTETKAPTGLTDMGVKGGSVNYEQDVRKYIVKTNLEGTTIEGLNTTPDGEFIFPNNRLREGRVVIKKRWKDFDKNRETPVLRLKPYTFRPPIPIPDPVFNGGYDDETANSSQGMTIVPRTGVAIPRSGTGVPLVIVASETYRDQGSYGSDVRMQFTSTGVLIIDVVDSTPIRTQSRSNDAVYFNLSESVGKFLYRHMNYKSEIKRIIFQGSSSGTKYTSLWNTKVFADLVNLETIEVKDALSFNLLGSCGQLFYGCAKLSNLPDKLNVGVNSVSSVVTDYDGDGVAAPVDNHWALFMGCDSLTSVKIYVDSNSKSSYSFKDAFAGCENLIQFEAGTDTMKVKLPVSNAVSMFSGTGKLNSSVFNELDMSKCKTAFCMFANSKIEEAYMDDIELNNCAIGGMFLNSSVQHVRFGKGSVVGVNDKFDINPFLALLLEYANLEFGVFAGASNLKTVDFGETMLSDSVSANLFYKCTSLTEVKNLKVSDSYYFMNMFYNCEKLENIDLSNVDLSKGVRFENMFVNCKSLKQLDLTGMNIGDSVNGILGYGTAHSGAGGYFVKSNKDFDDWILYCQNSFTANVFDEFITYQFGKPRFEVEATKIFKNMLQGVTCPIKLNKSLDFKFVRYNDPKYDPTKDKWIYNGDAESDFRNAVKFSSLDPTKIVENGTWGPAHLEKNLRSFYEELGFGNRVRYADLLNNRVLGGVEFTDSTDFARRYNADTDAGWYKLKGTIAPNEGDMNISEYVSTEKPENWVKEGDVWTYTFEVEMSDNIAGYTLYEDPINNYVADGELQADGKYKWEIGDKKEYTITNTSNDVINAGSISLKKNVIKSSGYDTDRLFKFKLNLSYNQKPIDDQILDIAIYSGDTHVRDDVLLSKNGACDILLKHNEKIVIKNLRSGTNYTVEELEPDYTATFNKSEGIISDKQNVEITCSNTYNKPIEPMVFTKLTLGKTYKDAESLKAIDFANIENHSDRKLGAYRFDFNISFENLVANSEFKYTKNNEEKSFVSRSDGTYVLDEKLGQHDVIKFTKLPVNAKYQVMESANKFFKASYELGDKSAIVDNKFATSEKIGTNKAQNKETDVDLSTKLETLEKDEDNVLVFTNEEIKPLVSLQKSGSDDKAFLDDYEFYVYSDSDNAITSGLNKPAGFEGEFNMNDISYKPYMKLSKAKGDSGYSEVNLRPGKYVFVENRAPKGYYKTDPVEVEVTNAGVIQKDGISLMGNTADSNLNVLKIMDLKKDIIPETGIFWVDKLVIPLMIFSSLVGLMYLALRYYEKTRVEG